MSFWVDSVLCVLKPRETKEFLETVPQETLVRIVETNKKLAFVGLKKEKVAAPVQAPVVPLAQPKTAGKIRGAFGKRS